MTNCLLVRSLPSLPMCSTIFASAFFIPLAWAAFWITPSLVPIMTGLIFNAPAIVADSLDNLHIYDSLNGYLFCISFKTCCILFNLINHFFEWHSLTCIFVELTCDQNLSRSGSSGIHYMNILCSVLFFI